MTDFEYSSRKPKKRDKDERVYKKTLYKYLSPEDVNKIVEGRKTYDISDALEILQKPFNALTSVIDQSITNIGKPRDITDIKEFISGDESISEAFKEGWSSKKKFSSRDILKKQFPDIYNKILEPSELKITDSDLSYIVPALKTGGKLIAKYALPVTELLGKLPEEMKPDLLTPVTFAADIAIDPINYLTKGASAALKLGGSAISGIASKYAPETVKKIEKASNKFYLTKIAPYTNIHAITESEGVSALFDDFITASEKGSVNAEKIVKDITRLKQKRSFVDALKSNSFNTEYLTEAESNVLGKGSREINDEGVKLFGYEKARRLGVSIDESSKISKFDDLVDEITLNKLEMEDSVNTKTMAKLKKREAELLSKLNGVIKTSKSETAKVVYKKVLEGKGYGKEASKIVMEDVKASREFAKLKYLQNKEAYRVASRYIKDDINNITKAMKSDVLLTNKSLKSHLSQTMNTMSDTYRSIVKNLNNSTDEGLDLLNIQFGRLKEQVSELNKYKLALNQNIKHARFDKKYERLVTMVNDVSAAQKSLGAAEVGIIRSGAMESKAGIKSIFKQMSKDTKDLYNIFKTESGRLGSKFKVSEDLNKFIMKDYELKLKELITDQDKLNRYMVDEVTGYMKSKSAINKMSPQMKKAYYKTISNIRKDNSQQVFRDMWAKRDEIFQKLADKHLPKELHEAAFKVRKVLDDYAVKLSKGEEPLLKGVSPLYFPRLVDRVGLEEILNTASRGMTKGKGFTKRRTFGLSTETDKFIKDRAKELGIPTKGLEDDAALILQDYLEKADMAYAKNVLKTELMSKYKTDDFGKVPLQIQKAFDWVTSGGKVLQAGHPILSKVFKGYGTVLRTIKAGLTVLNPAFYGRNIAGYPFFAATSAGMKHGFNPTNGADALAIMSGSVGKVGNYEYSQIRKAVDDFGYFNNSLTRGDIKAKIKYSLGRGKIWNLNTYLESTLREASKVEDFGRMGALVANLKSGMPIDKAMKEAQKAMFNYNLINSPVDKVMQGIFGFYTFSRRNLPRQVYNLFNDPKQYSTMSRILDNISNRKSLSDEDIDTLNNYEKSNFKIFGQMINGVRKMITLGFTPTEEAYNTVLGLTSGDMGKFIMNKANPMVTSFLEWAYGKDSLTGNDVGNVLASKYTEVIPKSLQKALGLTLVERNKYRAGEIVGKEKVLVGDPDTITMIRRLPFAGRQISDLGDLVQKIKQGKVVEGVVKYTAGVATKEFDIAQRKRMKEFEIQKKKRELAKKYGAKTGEYIYAPKLKKAR